MTSSSAVDALADWLEDALTIDMTNTDAASASASSPATSASTGATTMAPSSSSAPVFTTSGFTQTGLGCCGTGLVEIGELCSSLMPQCQSPAHYMFFDSVHPTQATYKALTDQIVQSQMPKFVKK